MGKSGRGKIWTEVYLTPGPVLTALHYTTPALKQTWTPSPPSKTDKTSIFRDFSGKVLLQFAHPSSGSEGPFAFHFGDLQSATAEK